MAKRDRRPRARPPADTWFVYLLRCADGTLYTGIAKDVSRRCQQHNAGTASRYTRSRLPVELVYQEAHPSRGSALKREAAIKAVPAREVIADPTGGVRGTPPYRMSDPWSGNRPTPAPATTHRLKRCGDEPVAPAWPDCPTTSAGGDGGACVRGYAPAIRASGPRTALPEPTMRRVGRVDGDAHRSLPARPGLARRPCGHGRGFAPQAPGARPCMSCAKKGGMVMSTRMLAPASPRRPPLLPNSRCHPEQPHRPRRRWATGLTKTGAEAVLDWLEAHGHSHCQVSLVAGEGFTVTECPVGPPGKSQGQSLLAGERSGQLGPGGRSPGGIARTFRAGRSVPVCRNGKVNVRLQYNFRPPFHARL
jgi:predicted GIY-YIG superfamily endonuclease